MGRGKRPYNFEITSKEVSDPERMIKRFMKKVSKLKILEEYIERTKYYKKLSQKRNEQKRRVKKEQRKNRLKNRR